MWGRLESEELSCVHLGPPCSSFSVARTPPVRSAARPAGLRGLKGADRRRVEQGNELAAFALDVMLWAKSRGVPATLEQPASSWMWRLAGFKAGMAPETDSVVVLDYCHYGAPWRKATRLWGVNCDLEPLPAAEEGTSMCDFGDASEERPRRAWRKRTLLRWQRRGQAA